MKPVNKLAAMFQGHVEIKFSILVWSDMIGDMGFIQFHNNSIYSLFFIIVYLYLTLCGQLQRKTKLRSKFPDHQRHSNKVQWLQLEQYSIFMSSINTQHFNNNK